MITMSFKKKKDFIPHLKKRLLELEEKSPVEIGYFPEQPKHPSGLEAANLMKILHDGSSTARIPSRPVFTIGMMLKPIDNSSKIKKQLKLYLTNIDRKKPSISATTILNTIGGDYVDTFRSIFGDRSKLVALSPATIAYKTRMGVPKPEDPLIFDGTLMNMMSYKINGVLITP